MARLQLTDRQTEFILAILSDLMTTSKYEMKYLFYALVSKNTFRQKMHAILARYCLIDCISMLSFSLLYALNTAEMHRNYID